MQGWLVVPAIIFWHHVTILLRPGGMNSWRWTRVLLGYLIAIATIVLLVYTNLIRRFYKNTVPIVLGGIEASLRRVTHYDYWTNKLRKPILFDSKADIIVYGMGETALRELVHALDEGRDYRGIRGLCYIAKEPVEAYHQLPSHEECLKEKEKFIDLFDLFYDNNDPISANGLCQKVDTRYSIQNPPCDYLDESEMDAVSALPFTRELHPYHRPQGKVKCLETIKFSIMTHQGCWGECNFCAIGVHQGRTIRTRSEASIVAEAKEFTTYKDFKGIISDVGGAQKAGLKGILVKTGKYREELAQRSEISPDAVIDSVADLPALLTRF